MSSSFHHLLLKGDGFFCGVVSAVALLIAFVMSLVNLSISSTIVSVFCSGRGGRYTCSLFFSAFQSVLVKLYGGCVGGVVRGVRSSMVSIGRWSEPWSFSVAIWHLIMLLIACSFPHTRLIAVFPPRNVIVPGGIISCISYWSIPSISSSACWSRLWCCGGFQSGWCRLKSPAIMIAWYWEGSMFSCRCSIRGMMRFSSLGL